MFDFTSSAISWESPERAMQFQQWINAIAKPQQLEANTVEIASADASFRRYFRVQGTFGNPSRIIMDAPPEKEDAHAFVHVAQLMQQAGVYATQVLDWDKPNGFMLLTDLGQHTMMHALDSSQPQAAQPYYIEALHILLRWQQASRPNTLPPYDEALLRRELQLFPDWYVAQHKQVTLNTEQHQGLDSVFSHIVQCNLAAPNVYVHRDYMPRNLMLSDTPSDTRLGLLDFQDAVYGPASYDIASLMRDAFISWDEEFVIDITVRYWEQARTIGLLDYEDWHSDFSSFYQAVEYMGLQRHLKVAGIFARLSLRDGKPKYVADTPRFIGYIRHTARRYQALKPLLKLLDTIEDTTDTVTSYSFGRMM